MIQLTLTLKMTTAQVVKTSVTVNNNSPIQDYVHPVGKLNLLLKWPLGSNLLQSLDMSLIFLATLELTIFKPP